MASAAGPALLGRLEDHHGGAGEVARLGEVFGGAEQHGGVAVMAAGVHLAGHGRLVGKVVRLLDRQRVHVGAQPDHLAGAARPVALDDADHAGAADPGHHLVAAERLELLGDRRRGAVHVVEQLRMGMDVVPPGGDLAMQVGYAIDDRHRNGSLLKSRTRRDVRPGSVEQNRAAAAGQGGNWSRRCRSGTSLRLSARAAAPAAGHAIDPPRSAPLHTPAASP